MSISRPIWFTGETVYEGFPLLLRTLTMDIAKVAPRFPLRVVVTHALAEVRDDGLPEAGYNGGLEDFDSDLIDVFGSTGTIVLVETFAGKRTYYFYVEPTADLAAAERSITDRYPQHDLTWESSEDPTWSLLRRYARDFDLPVITR